MNNASSVTKAQGCLANILKYREWLKAYTESLVGGRVCIDTCGSIRAYICR